MEVEEWILNTSKNLVDSDVYAARSWLLTAKSLFPQSFRLQVEEYMLELSKKNVEECSKVLNEIFRDFTNEVMVWEETEKLIQAVETSNDNLRKAVFDGLPAMTQQRMILLSAECRVNINEYCKLLLVLMNKFPDTVSQYGMSLTEKLVETEKKENDGTVVNQCRKMLVREVLPSICRGGSVGVSHKHFYKWLQKSTEFYASYFTCESESNVADAWSELEDLRTAIANQCGWSVDENSKGITLVERIAFMRDLFRRSRTDVDGAVNRKQIFYTTIILLFEAASKFMLLLDPCIYRGTDKSEDSYIAIVDVDSCNDEASSPIHNPIKKSSELCETFNAAKDAWTILHANESFEKDFNHLIRRWKSDRWHWFQLFLVNLNIYEGDHKLALTRLKQIEHKLQDNKSRLEIKLRTYCHLVSTNYALGNFGESCQYIFKCLSQFPIEQMQKTASFEHITHLTEYPRPPQSKFPLNNTSFPSTTKLKMVQMSVEKFLPFWIHILIESLQNVACSVEDDHVLGHTMVLSQHHWPTWRPVCKKILNRIAEKRRFHFELCFKYVINVDILEEIAFLKNQKSCQLTLDANQNTRAHVTRGVNREADEEFWNAIKRNVQRSGESIDSLLTDYLISCRDSITSSLNLKEPR